MNCKICGKKLSSYNKTKKCYHHSERNCFEFNLDMSEFMQTIKAGTVYSDPVPKNIIKKGPYRRFTKEEDSLLIRANKGGEVAELAKQFGRTKSSCHARRHKLNKKGLLKIN